MQRKLKLRATAVCAVVIMIVTCRGLALDPGQPASSYLRRYFTMEDGLPANEVHAIVQTENEFLWVGTDAGLARFDGKRFTPIIISGGVAQQITGHGLVEWDGSRIIPHPEIAKNWVFAKEPVNNPSIPCAASSPKENMFTPIRGFVAKPISRSASGTEPIFMSSSSSPSTAACNGPHGMLFTVVASRGENGVALFVPNVQISSGQVTLTLRSGQKITASS
jgi:hypothetical protein